MSIPLPIHAQALVADTVVTLSRQDGIAMAADIAILVAAAAVSVLAFVAVRVLLEWDRGMKRVQQAAREHFGPISNRAAVIGANVEFITGALRTDVERLNASVKALTERLHQASEHMEDRIEEFNALMELVQDEAEDIFLDTAATVRGVREGARAMGRGREEPVPPHPPPPSDGLPSPDDDEADAEAFLPGER